MKDIIKRISISIISGGLIGYLAYLFANNATIVQTEYLGANMIYYVILAVICVYLFVFFGVYPIHIKFTKPTLFIAGLALIVMGDMVLLNEPSKFVHVSDLFKLIGVIITLLAWTNVLITDKVKKKKEDSKIEIIEV